MEKKFKSILLVDDDPAVKLLNKLILERTQCADKIFFASDGKEALDFLTSAEEGKYPKPDLILLDINMPVMDGWEFIEEYKKLDISQKATTVLVMLTTSINPDDEARALSGGVVSGFRSKPLSGAMMEDIIAEFMV